MRKPQGYETEHLLKIMQRTLHQRLRELVMIDGMQFGFTKSEGTTDALFLINVLQEIKLKKQRNLFFAFVDLDSKSVLILVPTEKRSTRRFNEACKDNI